jgi:hypothetical protein
MTSCNGRADSDDWCCGVNNTACCGSGVGIVKLPQKFLGIQTQSSSIVTSVSPSSSRTQSTSTSPTSSVSSSNSPSSSSSSLSGGAIAGITVGAVALIFLLTIAVLIYIRRKRYVAPQVSPYVPGPGPQYPPTYEIASGQEVASEKYASRTPVEMMVPPSELSAEGRGR